jgi:hypothetical protein
MEQDMVVMVWFLCEQYIPLVSLVDLGESLRQTMAGIAYGRKSPIIQRGGLGQKTVVSHVSPVWIMAQITESQTI